ncbi:MAG: AAA domain-containing protein [Candidatus Scalindua sp.]
MSQAVIDEDKDRSIRLFTYLRELVRLRSKIIRDISAYDETLWLHQIPHENGWYSGHWEGEEERTDDTWVEIKKPQIPVCPTPPLICEGWYSKGDLFNTEDMPSIQKIRHVTVKAETGEIETETQEIEEHSEIEQAWNGYLEKEWLPWKQGYEKVRPLQDIYSKLFRMYQLSNKLGESYETVLGIGFFVWKNQQDQEIRRHIIGAQARIEFDSNTGGISIKPGADGARMIFENDMLDPSELPQHEELQALEESLKENSEDPWDSSIVHAVIRSWIHALNADSVFSSSDKPPALISSDPNCNFAPAVILRKRTQRGWITAFDNIINGLKSSTSVPDNTKKLINLSSDVTTSRVSGESSEPITTKQTTYSVDNDESHVYFPLPTNAEQLEIIQRLNKSNGVRVQGPPGTGKSQAIVNMICHFLATGQKILVTAYAPRALKVLQERIPDELTGLCVSVLGHDVESVNNLQRSVNEITEKYNDWDESANTKSIKETKKGLDKYKEELSKTRKRLRELREQDTYKFNELSGYEGTVQEISKLIKSNESRYGWIPDRIEPGTSVPLLNHEFKKLLHLLRDINDSERASLSMEMVKSSELVEPDIFLKIIKDEKEVKGELETCKHYSEDHKFLALLEVDVRRRVHALGSITQLRMAIDEGLRRPFDWLEKAVYDMLADQDQPLRSIHEVSKTRMEGLAQKAQKVDDYHFDFTDIDKVKVLADAQDLYEYLKSGGKIGGWLFKNKLIGRTKYLWDATFIDGRKCNNVTSLEKILDVLDVDKRINLLWKDWTGKVQNPGGLSYVAQLALLLEQLEALDSILAIDRPLQRCKELICELSILSEPKWHKTEEIIELEKLFKAIQAFETEKEINNKIEKIGEPIDHCINLKNPHPINQEFRVAIVTRDLDAWTKTYHKLKEFEERSKLFSEREVLFERLKENIPELSNDLINTYEDSVWEQRSEGLENAWKWSLADTWLQDYEAKHDSEKLNSLYVTLEEKIMKTTATLCSSMAWDHCFKPMTNEQRTTLLAWKEAVRRIGSGKRKGSAQAQKDAEHYMKKCSKIIPAWIMPLYRVLDTVAMDEPEIFDVVIVDEASQCGPEALLVHYLAKKVIIVGDSEQVAPENVGVQVGDVQRLRELYLENIPFADSLGRDSTLFTNAELRLRERVFLREHFRCMPEIIQFCNDLCYAPQRKPLIPLRQYGVDRLEPPVNTIFVEGGYRDRSSKGEGFLKTNHPEAKRVVETISNCHDEPEYKDKTFGVISMLGNEQSKLIEGMLMKVLKPTEYEKRKLLCGTPATFQGDERDVIFMTMVDSPESGLRAVAAETDKRRFNVGVSRAKDQLWVFHSFQESDLKNNCFRQRLLNYCRNPRRVFEEGSIDDCETEFERNVYTDISSKGYKVVPQVNVAGKRIDLVIEGMRARLAVECDGDEWHGPDRWDADTERQRTLERCGWAFWRVRGSEYYRDPEGALLSLWDLLDDMQIYPQGIDMNNSNDSEQGADEGLESDQYEDEVEDEEVNTDTHEEQADFSEPSIATVRDLNPANVRKLIICLLQEKSRGKDLLSTAVIKRAGLAIRGQNRSKIVSRINRVANKMLREGEIEQYKTQKRIRLRLPSDMLS